MTTRELILKEIEAVPEAVLTEVLIFLRFLKSMKSQERFESALLSESALQKDWLLPEEDEAWQDL